MDYNRKFILWMNKPDARGGMIGVTESSDEHPGCIDIIGDFSNGYVVFVRIKRENINELISVLNLFISRHPVPTANSPGSTEGDERCFIDVGG